MKNLGTASRARGSPVRVAAGLAGLRGWPCLLTPVDERLSPCHHNPMGQRVRWNQLACCWRFPVRGLGEVLVDRGAPGLTGRSPPGRGSRRQGGSGPGGLAFPAPASWLTQTGSPSLVDGATGGSPARGSALKGDPRSSVTPPPPLGRVTCHHCSVQRGAVCISTVSMETVNKQSVIEIEKFCLSQTDDYSGRC